MIKKLMLDKKYNEFQKSRPAQLDLFSFENIYANKKDIYSATTELYDIAPKYYYGELADIRENGKYLEMLSRDFEHRGQKMKIIIRPARTKRNNIEKEFFPSQREEIIEDVLRKFATDKTRNEFLDDRLAVKFTLYELWKELKKIKHTYNYEEIELSLEILKQTNMEITSTNSDGVEILISSNMFETFARMGQSDNDPNNKMYFVRFNSLVSDSIKNKTWRLLNYEQCMKYKRSISRWLHKRISHIYLQATIEIPYPILLSTIIRDSGMRIYDRIKNNLEQLEICLKEMMVVGSIEKYEIEKRFDKNKLIDAKFLIYMSKTFIEDIRLGNYINNENKKEVKSITSSEIKTTIEKIKSFLKDKINLKDNEIKKIANFVLNNETIESNLKAGITYIEKQKLTEKKVNEVAILIMSIKENWQSNLSNEIKEYKIETQEETISKIMVEEIKDSYKKIKEKWVKQFGVATYNAWLKRLIFISDENDILILNIDNAFMKEIIEKDYLNGKYRKQNGIKTLLQKGMIELVRDIIPSIKEINIRVIKI